MEESAVTEERNERLDKVMAGGLADLPALSSKIVRIFTSSTFTDTTHERNALMETVYPRIKEFCREKHGLEFQVVDMRWGVRDEATDDHMTTELCMTEIENCQRLSMGPNFVVFLGQKYGYRPIPTIMDANQFDMLRDVIKNVDSDVEILDTWYKKDDNNVPPVYVLQPISSILVNFNNKRHQRLMEQDQNLWWETMEKLQKMLRKAAQVLLLARKIDREHMHNYFMSVTEREIERGILKAKDTKDHCMAYVRHISNVNLTLLRFARNFIDMAARDVDSEAQKLLTTLRDDKLPQKLPAANIARFVVEWSGKEGIDRETHAEYLKEFCSNFYSNITMLVDRAVISSRKLSGDAVYSEVLQQLHSCQTICKFFQGREDKVERIRQYMSGAAAEPLVLHGESGCGKTSLLAKSFSQVPSWLGHSRSVMLIRFLGTTPDSSSVLPMLKSLCQQLAFNFRQPYEEIPDELSPMTLHFKKLLAMASDDKPIVIYLDSLDQLSGADGAHQLSWLPIALPPFVKIVVSTLPNYYGILDTLRRMITSDENYVQITPLGENLGSVILKSWMKDANKNVTEEHWKIVQEALSRCNLPLFVKLVFDEISRWRSYFKPSQTTLAYTIHDSIVKLFDRVENQHGKILVSHALGYLTASKSGLSEAELEDLLSLDEKVLNDVYQYHLPPVRRIPPLLWTRIRADLPKYFSEREADGVNVIDWYHRQFIEASRERYFRNLNFVAEMHSCLADYFLGLWGGKPKPFEYSDLQRSRFFLEDKTGESDRKVPEQPLYFTDVMGNITRYNLRKLNELPYHLIRAHRNEDLYTEVLFNLKWLHSKLNCMPLQAVLADFEDALEHQYDKDVKLVADALRLSSSILSHYPSMLGPNIVGRLLPYFSMYEKIRTLIHQCDSDGLHMNALVPSYHCLHTPGGPLQYSLEGHPFAPFGVRVTSDLKYIISVSNKFIIWDLSTGDVFRQVIPGIEGIMQNLTLSPNDKYAASFTNNNQIVLCSVMTGDYKVIEKPIDSQDQILGTSVNNTQLIVWTSKEWYLYTVEGARIKKEKVDKTMPLIQMDTNGIDEPYMVLKSGEEGDDDMALEIQDSKTDPFDFHSAIAIAKDRQTVYACIAISDDAVAVYRRHESGWSYDRTLGDNYDKIFGLTLSFDENYLCATIASGYKLWNLKNDKMVVLKLPTGIRNIPNKNQITSLVVFTKNNEFVVAGVRKNLYVWDAAIGTLVKTLDAHFGRITVLVSVNKINKIVSSSIDKSIKVWNFDNILEDVHSIDRQEKPIDAISIASSAFICATTTRNCVGIWNLENGKIIKTLANSAHSSIVTHSTITADSQYVVSAESGNVIIWDINREKVIKVEQQRDVQQLIMTDSDSKVIAISKVGFNKAKVVCRTVPEGEKVYEFDYNIKAKFKTGVVSCDGLFLVVVSANKNNETIGVYHAKTGTHLYDMTPKYANFQDFSHIIAMPNDAHQIALIDPEKGNIWDIKKKGLVRSILKWNGECTHNGKFGLYAPNRGGLEIIELKHGKTVHTLIPRVAEGVFNVSCFFTKSDQHVVYYHSGHRSIRVFRVLDGRKIADFKAHAEITAIAGTDGGTSIVLGSVDGSVTMLTIADPKSETSKEYLASLSSRQVNSPMMSITATPNVGKEANGSSIGAAVQVARFVAKTKTAQRSRACCLQ